MSTRWQRITVTTAVVTTVAVLSSSCAIFETPPVNDVISGVQTLDGTTATYVAGGAPQGPGPANEATAIGAARR